MVESFHHHRNFFYQSAFNFVGNSHAQKKISSTGFRPLTSRQKRSDIITGMTGGFLSQIIIHKVGIANERRIKLCGSVKWNFSQYRNLTFSGSTGFADLPDDFFYGGSMKGMYH